MTIRKPTMHLKRISGPGLYCQLLHSLSQLPICHQNPCVIPGWPPSAGSDSFPKSVPWLGQQSGSVLHPACSICLLSNICYWRRQGWVQLSGLPGSPAPVRSKGLDSAGAKDGNVLVFYFDEGGANKVVASSSSRAQALQTRSHGKHFKRSKLYH